MSIKLNQLSSMHLQGQPDAKLLLKGKGFVSPFDMPSAFPFDKIRGFFNVKDGGTMAVGDNLLGNSNKLSIALKVSWIAFQYWLVKRLKPASNIAVLDKLVFHCVQFGGFWPDIARRIVNNVDGMILTERDLLLSSLSPKQNLSQQEIERIVENGFNASIQNLFASFDFSATRVSDFSESYRATLMEKSFAVEVKIQRPDLEKLLRRDLHILQFFNFFVRRRRKNRHVLSDLIADYTQQLPANLDFRFEASIMQRMRRSLDRHNIYVPKLFNKHISKEVLVFEFVDAPTLADVCILNKASPLEAESWLGNNLIDLHKVGKNIYQSILRQIFEDNFFLRNLSPDNVRVMRENRLALVSCDETTSVDKRFLMIFNVALSSLENEAYEKFVDTLFLLCSSLKVSDLSKVRTDLIYAVRAYAARSQVESVNHAEKSLLPLMSEIASILRENGIVLDKQVYRVTEALRHADSSVSSSYPEINYRAELRRYVKKATKRRLKSMFEGGMLKAASSMFSPIREVVQFEAAALRKKAQRFKATSSKAAKVGATLVRWFSRAVVVGGIYGIWVYFHHHHYEVISPFHDTQASDHALSIDHISVGSWILIFISTIFLYKLLREVVQHLSRDDIDRSH